MLASYVLITLCLAPTQGVASAFPDGYDSGLLANPIYQESNWVKTRLKLDERGEEVIRRLSAKLAGSTYRLDELAPYRTKYLKKLDFETGFEYAVAFMCLHGYFRGERIAAPSTFRNREHGMHEYWALAKHWPKSPSRVHYLVRAVLYESIEGNIQLQKEAFENYVAAFPDDLNMKLQLIDIKFNRHNAWEKLSPELARKLAVEAYEGSKKLRTTRALRIAVRITSLAADLNKDISLNKLACEQGELVLPRLKANPFEVPTFAKWKSVLEKRQKLNLKGKYGS